MLLLPHAEDYAYVFAVFSPCRCFSLLMAAPRLRDMPRQGDMAPYAVMPIRLLLLFRDDAMILRALMPTPAADFDACRATLAITPCRLLIMAYAADAAATCRYATPCRHVTLPFIDAPDAREDARHECRHRHGRYARCFSPLLAFDAAAAYDVFSLPLPAMIHDAAAFHACHGDIAADAIFIRHADAAAAAIRHAYAMMIYSDILLMIAAADTPAPCR